MKRLLIPAAIVCGGAVLFWSQHHRRNLTEKQNVRLGAMVATLKQRAADSARAQALAEERLRPLVADLSTRKSAMDQAPPALPEARPPVPPDPSRQGGWPHGADYFYLPKTFLQQANFQVLHSQQLSAEAVSLYNLSEPERAEVDRAIGDLFAQFRSAEIERMELIDLPEEWSHGQFTSGVAYRIPSFAEDVNVWRQAMGQRLEATLGAERSRLLGGAIEDHLRQEWNDLGESERTVGFMWKPERNGNYSLWSAVKDQRHGDGTFRRYFPGEDEDSSIRHYAELMGVELPNP